MPHETHHLTYIPLDDLISGEHRKRMGSALWAYILLGQHADPETHELPFGREEAARLIKRHFRAVNSTVYRWLRSLVAGGYVYFVKSEQSQSRDHVPLELRWSVWERDDFTCQNCGSRRFLTIDHVVPLSRGGSSALSNLQTLCEHCNKAKGARTADEWEVASNGDD